MAFLSSMDICASGLTAQRMRLDVSAENITNRDTTRTEAGGAYRKKSVVFQATNESPFRSALALAAGNGTKKGGVEVAQIVEDQSPLEMVYNPSHPDANENGYVEMPNVNTLAEITDAMSASRSYDANLTALNAIKTMASKALEIGR